MASNKKENNGARVVIGEETAAALVLLKKILAYPRGCSIRFLPEDSPTKTTGFHTITSAGMASALRLLIGFDEWVGPGSTADRAMATLKARDNGSSTVQTIFTNGRFEGAVKPGSLTETLNVLVLYGLLEGGKNGGKNTYRLSETSKNLLLIAGKAFDSEIAQAIMAIDTEAALKRLSFSEQFELEPKK